jgi:hypothetical protein
LYGPEKKKRIRQAANQLAKETLRGSVSAYWWLPLDSIRFKGIVVGGFLLIEILPTAYRTDKILIDAAFRAGVELREAFSSQSTSTILAWTCAG